VQLGFVSVVLIIAAVVLTAPGYTAAAAAVGLVPGASSGR